MKIKECYTCDVMPLDKVFDTENGKELCHATGFMVTFEGDNTYWDEYIDSNGEYHYGR